MQATLTEKSRTKLQHNGHSYIFHKPSADGEVRFWSCERHHAKDIRCKGRLHTNLNNNVLREVGNHQCEPSAARMEAQRVITGIKRRAEQTMEPPATIRSLALQNVATPVLAQLPTKNAIKKVIKRVRHEINAPLPIPNTLTDIIIPDAYKTYGRTEEQTEQFLLSDSGVYQKNGREQRILIFGRESNGRWAHEMKECFADGTFSITPMPFQQVYAILARRNRWVIPVCYCMLSNKTHTKYERMFRMLVAVWPDFNPDSVSMDFETAAITALNLVFPFTEVRGCLFHLVQNFHKKISEFGLKQRYQNDPTFAEMARCVTSIAFLPIGDLTPGIIALDMALPDELTPVLDWFIMNYTGRVKHDGSRTRPRFDPNIWSVYTRTLQGDDRTNNHSEAANRRLQCAFACSHPSIWRFIDLLRKDQKLSDDDFAKCSTGQEPPLKAKKYRYADRRILTMVQNYLPLNNGDNNIFPIHQPFNHHFIITFLIGISRNYEMRP